MNTLTVKGLSSHLNLIDEIRPAITWDYFSNGDQAENPIRKMDQ